MSPTPLVLGKPPTSSRHCRDGECSCPSNSTRCSLSNHTANIGCCLLSNAKCCSDSSNCCPHGYDCKVVSPGHSECIHTVPFSRFLLLHTSKSHFCPDHKTICKDSETCCQIKADCWACCPVPNATCCGNLCCEQGHRCCPKDKTCINDTLVVSGYLPNEAHGGKSVDSYDCSIDEIECSVNQTCCGMDLNKFGCCPDTEARCCSDGQQCCPYGHRCLPNGKCINE